MATASASKPRCSVYIATSVDGFIARADDGLDWLKAVEAPGEDYGYAAFMQSVDGGALIRDFMKAGLIDDLTLSIIPIVLGSGIPLWADPLRTDPLRTDAGAEHLLRLESSQSFPSGLVQNRYVVARHPPSGGQPSSG